MLHQLSATFDLVILDTGPLQSEACLAMTMAERNAVNAIIAVVDRRQSNSEDLEQGLRQIRRVGVSSVGLVENFAD
jgi:Mrp family chromosome partitioning ATPase